MLPPGAAHGAVALDRAPDGGPRAARADLGRRARAGLLFSVALLPPPPVAVWPELTLVAAEAVADAIGPAASIKHPNDVLVDGKKVAGILAEAQERVVLGIGINVGRTAWAGAGAVEARPAGSCSSTCSSGSSSATSPGSRASAGDGRPDVAGRILRDRCQSCHDAREAEGERALGRVLDEPRLLVDDHGDGRPAR